MAHLEEGRLIKSGPAKLMLDWFQKKIPGSAGLEDITRKFEQMLEDGRHVFDAAANGLLGGTDPEVIRQDLFATDKRINATEMAIRRQLVVHGSVHGSLNLPELLVMMSLVKDAERIGDYAKNIFDLSVQGARFWNEEERQRLIAMKDQISKLLVRARNIYDEQDEPGAVKFLQDADRMEDACDDGVKRLLRVEDRNTAAAILCWRYFKRVISHAANIVTSLVMPVDKLDFFDEPKV